jgi:hypothetical protein
MEYVPYFPAIYDAVRWFRTTKEFEDGQGRIGLMFGDYDL